MSSKKEQDWSNARLQKEVETRITKMFEGTLDFSEVAVGDERRYKVLRSKILRLANDTIRALCAEISENYEVLYQGISQDIVKIQKSRKGEANEQ